MKKKLIFKYFIFIFLFSFNQVIAEECDLEFEIGDDASKAIFSMVNHKMNQMAK